MSSETNIFRSMFRKHAFDTLDTPEVTTSVGEVSGLGTVVVMVSTISCMTIGAIACGG